MLLTRRERRQRAGTGEGPHEQPADETGEHRTETTIAPR